MDTGLIGREHAVGIVHAEIARSVRSHGGLVLLSGEAGIGKTLLVTSAAEEMRRRDGLVLAGSCWDSGSAPGYWPWTQVIRGLRRAAPEAATGRALAVLLGNSGPDGAESVSEFELFDAVTTALVAVSQTRPVAVVLEDLHWADPASVRLLEFAAQHIWFERLLVLGTYRDVEVDADDHPLRPAMTRLLAKATPVTLTGLAEPEVGALIQRTSGQEPPPGLVADVHRRTGGNPFFVEQLARLWRGGDTVGATPPGVRDAVWRRVELLPAPVRDILATAAVLGGTFHRGLLASVEGAPVAQVDRQLAQAVTARLVNAGGAGWFAFAHDLVRETLYESVDPEVRAARHAEVVRAVRTNQHGEPVHAAELARHVNLAGGEVDAPDAVELLLNAARDADGRFANDEAIAHYRRALDRAGEVPKRRVVIRLYLRDALARHGDRQGARAMLNAATAEARELADPALLARVALSLGAEGDELLGAAHRDLVGDPARAAPLSRDELIQEVTTQLAVLARKDGDDEALAFSLSQQHHGIWALGAARQRLALTGELVALARRSGDLWLEHLMTSFRWVALLELGEPAYLDQYHALVDLVEEGKLPRFTSAFHIDRAIIAALRGRFDDAGASISRAASEFQTSAEWENGVGYFINHMRWSMLLHKGNTAEIDVLAERLARDGHPYPQLINGIGAARRGDVATALRCLPDHRGGRTPYSPTFAVLGLRLLAETAAISADPELCALARDQLAAHSGLWLVAMWGCEVSGPVDLWLGMLDAAERDWDGAIARFTAAYRSADLLGARPWAAEARARLAEALLARGADDDRAAGTTLLDEAGHVADELGLRYVTGRIRRARATEAPDTNEFRRDGPLWILGFGGHVVHMPDTKGLRDLNVLLGSQGTDIPAVRLLDPGGGETLAAAGKLGGDPVLDGEAKARYRRRLGELDAWIDAATGRGDDDAAAGFDRERAALLDELRKTAGLAGRDRRLGDETERARKAVTARIRDTLRKLDNRHPALAEHLRATVTTGATCGYHPATPVNWRL